MPNYKEVQYTLGNDETGKRAWLQPSKVIREIVTVDEHTASVINGQFENNGKRYKLIDETPVETAPVETAPVETAPVETAPVETAPVETITEPITDTIKTEQNGTE